MAPQPTQECQSTRDSLETPLLSSIHVDSNTEDKPIEDVVCDETETVSELLPRPARTSQGSNRGLRANRSRSLGTLPAARSGNLSQSASGNFSVASGTAWCSLDPVDEGTVCLTVAQETAVEVEEVTALAERGLKIWPAILSIVVGLVVRFLVPVPEGVTTQAWQLLAIFLCTVVGLVAGPLPVGAWSFCMLTFAILTKTLTFQQAFKAYLNDVIWLIVMAFFFARGFVKTGLGARVATYFVKFLGKSTLGLAYGLTLSEMVISPAMPSTTARAGGIYVPIIAALGDTVGSHPRRPSARKLAAFLTQAQVQAAGPSSALFMTAAAQNMLAIALGEEVCGVKVASPWMTWLYGACFPAAICLLMAPLMVYYVYPPEIKTTPDAPEQADRRLAEMGPMKKDEKIVCAVMLAAVFLWMLGDVLKIKPAVTAMCGLVAYLFLGVLDWNDCLHETAAWDTLAWFTVLVGMSSNLNEFGIIGYFADSTAQILAGFHLGKWGMFLTINAAYFFVHYMFASQTAHVAALAPAFIKMLHDSGVSPLASIMVIGYNTNMFGAITHYSSGQSAVYFGSGYVTLPEQLKVGFIVGIASIVMFFAIGSAWWVIIGWL